MQPGGRLTAGGVCVPAPPYRAAHLQDTLPQPNNPDVKIQEIPSHLAAALTFRGHIR